MPEIRFHKVTRDRWGRLPGSVRPAVLIRDYGDDVYAFNCAHGSRYGCRLARTAGSDITECDTHSARVRHGVPVILR